MEFLEKILNNYSNEITYLVFFFTITGILQLFLWLKKVVSFIKAIFILFVCVIAVSLIAPLIFTVLGIIFTIRITIKVVRFFKKYNRKNLKSEKNNPVKNNPDSFYLESNLGVLEIANIYRGIIIQGGAGSGKSKSLFYPFIQQAMTKGFSGILYDFKSPELSELANYYHSFNQESQLKFLNFKDHNTSARVNPLSPRYITKQAVAFELATVLINNLLPESIKKKDYWTRSSISVVAGAIWFLRNNYPQYCTIPHLISFILDFSSPYLIEVISSDIETAGMISSLKEAHEMKAEKQIAGVVGTVKNTMAQLNIPELFYMLSEDDIDLEINNPDNPTFLCIGNDSSLADTYAPIISLIISVCLRQMNQPKRHRSVVFLDEAPTLYIPNFEQIPATARSNKIATVYGLQDYSQMIDKYGQDKAQVMISNLGNQFFGRTVNEQTAKMVINLFGKHDQTFQTSSQSSGNSSSGLFGHNSNSSNRSVSETVQQRERVKIADITNMSAGKFYGVIAEGNQTELLGVQLKASEENLKPFEQKNEIDPIGVFHQIHSEVKNVVSIEQQKEDEFKIEL
jgi:type IV secretory pathway TraG/TraD family ATPase VirD4